LRQSKSLLVKLAQSFVTIRSISEKPAKHTSSPVTQIRCKEEQQQQHRPRRSTAQYQNNDEWVCACMRVGVCVCVRAVWQLQLKSHRQCNNIVSYEFIWIRRTCDYM